MIPSSTLTSTTLNIVVDTNQFLSVFIFHGMMKVAFDLILDKKLNLYVSLALREEILKKLHYFEVDQKLQDEAMLFIDTRGILIRPSVQVDVCRDPEDNFMLELAEEAQANYLITRDKDLLELLNQGWKGTKIMKPEDFLPLLRKKGILG